MTNPFATTPRKLRITDKRRAEIFAEYGGLCYLCGAPIRVGDDWELEHVTALMAGGADDISNLRPVHPACHKPKTVEDHAIAARARDVYTKHVVPVKRRQKSNPMPGTFASGWKKKMNGKAERR